MTVYAWDATLAPKAIAFNRRGMTVSGPVSLSGRALVTAYDAGYWIATASRLPAAGPTRVKAYRRQFARLEGGAHQILVPVFDRANAPWPVAGVYSDTSTFSDGTDFTDGADFADTVIQATLAAAASARATQIEVTETAIAEVVGGEYFSVGLGHLHVITQVLDDGLWRIWPPLRAPLAAGAELNFDNPVCRMRLTNEGSDDLDLEMGRYGFPSLEFVECFDAGDTTIGEASDVSCQKTSRILDLSADTTLAADEVDELRINNISGAARTITLPPAANRGRRHLRIVDYGGNAATYNLTIDGNGSETIMGASTYVIDSNGASIELSPIAETGNGWD